MELDYRTRPKAAGLDALDALKAASGPLSTRQVAVAIGRSRTTTANVLRRLEEKGLIVQEAPAACAGPKSVPALWRLP